MRGPVVVGVDGSPSSLVAVETAARTAERQGVELQLVHAVDWPAGRVTDGVGSWGLRPEWDHGGANGALAEAERRARSAAPRVDVRCEVLVGEPARVLESESRDAGLTVVGHRRTGPGGSRHHSVAGQLLAHGSRPVLVVCGRREPAGSVVLVGGESMAARKAAEFAFAEAEARGVPLLVLDTRRLWQRRSHSLPASLLIRLRGRHPEVKVNRRVVKGRIRRTLITLSADAQLVVAGAHGRRGTAGPLDEAVLRDVRCPVAAVRSERG
ncbi:universal stress protein [Streptomyces sp. NPDC051576]|uniref:universal stress protein n=1 Tax=Streptomyces sp. NPDC051576 TaxID=3155803 RepID=UPI0034165804